jgi:hypothetical protein
MHKLRQMLVDELKKYENRTDLSLNSLDAVYKIASTIKNIDKIEMRGEHPKDEWEPHNMYREEPKKPRTEKEQLVDSLVEVMKDATGHEREIYRKIIAMLEA